MTKNIDNIMQVMLLVYFFLLSLAVVNLASGKKEHIIFSPPLFYWVEHTKSFTIHTFEYNVNWIIL